MAYFRDTWIEVNLDAIFHNVSGLKRHYAKDGGLIAVVKADAYGHGAVMVAKTAIEAGANMLAVATLDEALELRANEIDAPILVFGFVRPTDLTRAAENRITVTAFSLDWVKHALTTPMEEVLEVHLKVDTGMNRLGIVDEQDFLVAYRLLKNARMLRLTGIYTHLASADEKNPDYYLHQFDLFKSRLAMIDTNGLCIHFDNSSSTLSYPENHLFSIRPGITLYGMSPASHMSLKFPLRPALSLYSTLVQVKQVPPKSPISYNGLYLTSDWEWIGTIPIGYADGWDRRMKEGVVWLDGREVPIVGRICMDYCMVVLPREYPVGTIVELIGPHITVEDVATRIGTNNYQTTCALSDRLVRVYKRNGKTIEIINRRLHSGSKERGK